MAGIEQSEEQHARGARRVAVCSFSACRRQLSAAIWLVASVASGKVAPLARSDRHLAFAPAARLASGLGRREGLRIGAITLRTADGALATALPVESGGDGEARQAAVRATQRWMQSVIVDLNLCPYAAQPASRGAFVYAVSDATSCEDFAADFFEAATDMLVSLGPDEDEEDDEDVEDNDEEEGHNEDEEEGSNGFDYPPSDFDFPDDPSLSVVLIAPGLVAAQVPFSAFSTVAAELEDECINDGELNPAFFHPEWVFEGLEAANPVNFERRAPLPCVTLLHAQCVRGVVAKGLERGVVVGQEMQKANEATLCAQGHVALQERLRACSEAQRAMGA